MTSPHHASPATSPGVWTGSLTDFRHAFRLLWKSKRITATTLITLALCIGATTAIFSSVYSPMLKPLPFQEPERMVELYSSAPKAGLNHMPANVPFYLDYSRNATSYESVGLWTFFYGLVGDKDSVIRTPGVRMTAEADLLERSVAGRLPAALVAPRRVGGVRPASLGPGLERASQSDWAPRRGTGSRGERTRASRRARAARRLRRGGRPSARARA
jgi:hypothetical protein